MAGSAASTQAQLDALLSEIERLEAVPITEPEPVTIKVNVGRRRRCRNCRDEISSYCGSRSMLALSATGSLAGAQVARPNRDLRGRGARAQLAIPPRRRAASVGAASSSGIERGGSPAASISTTRSGTQFERVDRPVPAAAERSYSATSVKSVRAQGRRSKTPPMSIRRRSRNT